MVQRGRIGLVGNVPEDGGVHKAGIGWRWQRALRCLP
jgi:hypothetical protein